MGCAMVELQIHVTGEYMGMGLWENSKLDEMGLLRLRVSESLNSQSMYQGSTWGWVSVGFS